MYDQSRVMSLNSFIGIAPDVDISHRWREIIRCKQEFMENGIDPNSSPFMSKEVADSWIRSKKFGLNEYSMDTAPSIDSEKLNKVFKQNQELINIALPLFDNFKPLLTESGYMLTLVNSNGIVLYRNGNTKIVERYGNHLAPGAIWTESTIGTCAHALSLIHKKPITLLGPEHFPAYFQNDITSAAPIFNSEGKVIAVLILVQKLGKNPMENNLHNLQLHTLGWVTSMAMEIKAQLDLKHSKTRFENTYTVLQTAIKMATEGIIVINQAGVIQHINSTAAKIFNTESQAATGHKIDEFLVKNSALTLKHALTNTKTISSLEVEVKKKNGMIHTYGLSIQPFPKDANNGMGGGVIKITDNENVYQMASINAGSKTEFNFESIIGDSPAMTRTKEIAKRFASSSANILLIGESGTGKELFAQAIHNEYRPEGPFIVLNCAAIPKSLVESELFGYDSGAFTGAKKSGSPGKIELAQGGTLFLDEIGDMPLDTQAVLLRVLEDKQVLRIGGNQYRTVDFRLVAATNKDLRILVRNGEFREDLYYRLSVLKIIIPPLRQRAHDIISLAEFFIKKYNWHDIQPKLSMDAKVKLMEYSWPGNVRQLENAMIYALNITDGNHICPEHLPDEIIQDKANKPNKTHPTSTIKSEYQPDVMNELNNVMSFKEAEKIVIQNALAKTGNNVCIAAELLGISKSTLYRKLKMLGID